MSSANVWVVDDDPTLLELLRMRLESAQYRVTTAQREEEAIAAVRGQTFDLSIVDLKLSRGDGISLMEEVHSLSPEMPIIILTAHGTIESAVEAMRKGAYSYLTKPFESRDLLFQIEKALENRRLTSEVQRLQELLREKYDFARIVAKSEKMQAVLEMVSRIAKIDTTVYIHGESGTGKELIARAKHAVLVLLVLGVVVGAGIVIGTQVMVSATGTNEFCGTTCHEMQTALKELEESSHGRNKTGVTASCHDCHIPHEYPANLVHKAMAGAKDVYHHLLGTISTPEKYEQNRARMAKAELERLKRRDSAECRHCHDAKKMDPALQTGFAAKRHREATETRKTCVECHTGVAHNEAEEK